MLDGFLLLDKPLGMSSAFAVAVVKRLLREQVREREMSGIRGQEAESAMSRTYCEPSRASRGKLKIGHAGTLDPLASGLLPLAIGEATKAIRFVVDAEKEYEFAVRWGQQRSTDDAEGVVVAQSAVRPSREAIIAALEGFKGRVMQRPPAFSAIKVDGERAYALARGGEEVVLAERPVDIYALELLEMVSVDEARFRVACGKGTYVRSLARDLAVSLGTVGYVSALRRTKVGKFSVNDAFLLVNEATTVHNARALEHIMPLARALADIPALELSRQDAQALYQGKILRLPEAQAGFPEGTEFCAFCEGTPVGIVAAQAGHVKSSRMFNLYKGDDDVGYP